MSLAPGTTLGPYEVLAPLGAGGMGEVYRARDARLDRDVAIKILPELFASDADRLARFEREAKTLASLSHPNIAVIYEMTSGVFSGPGPTEKTPDVISSVLVMELLEGQTLRDRLASGALPAREAIGCAVQIAHGLAAAHDKGIAHRDLKPENLFVAADGRVKILDFGLAKLLDPGGATMTGGAGTAAGSVMGTVGYMAPEQVRGVAVDHRADIFAFGAVLHEMLSGRSPFHRDSAADTISATLNADPPDLDQSTTGVSPALDRIVRRCLEKRPEARFQSAHDLAFALESIGGSAGSTATIAASDPDHARRRLALTLGILALVVLAVAAGWFARGGAPAPVGTRVSGKFSYVLPDGVVFTRTGRRSVAISPDGTKIAFIANQEIYLRHLHELEARPIRGTKLDPADLTFSPDGQSLAFFVPDSMLGTLAGATLKKVAIAGGPVTTVCPTNGPQGPIGVRWQGTRIVFSTGNRIEVVAETGGLPETLVEVTPASGEWLAQPQFINDGHDLLYHVGSPGMEGDVVVQRLGSPERRVLLKGAADARVLPTGHLIFVRDDTLFGQMFDSAAQQLVGDAVPLIEGVRPAFNSGGSHSAVADNGTLVYVPGRGIAVSDLIWVDRQGREETVGAPALAYDQLRLSPDSTRVVASAGRDLWLWDFSNKLMSKLTSGPEVDVSPVWSLDSRSIVYRSNPAGQIDVFRRAADGTGQVEQLTDTVDAESPLDVLSDGGLLLRVLSAAGAASARLAVLPKAGAGAGSLPSLLPTLNAQPIGAAVSPDGRWIAYQSTEGGTTDEIHVRPFPDMAAGYWRISSGGGSKPVWTRGGRELVFLGVANDTFTRRYMSVAVPPLLPGAGFSHGAPVLLFDSTGHITVGSPDRTYDVTADGSRFLISRGRADGATPSITIVTNWFDDIRARLSKGGR